MTDCEYRFDVSGGELRAIICMTWSKYLSFDDCIKELQDVMSERGNTLPLLVKSPPGFYTEARRFETPKEAIDFLVQRKAERFVDPRELDAVAVKDCPPSSWVVWTQNLSRNVKAIPFSRRDEAVAYYKSSWLGKVLCAERTYELKANGPVLTLGTIRKAIAAVASSLGIGVNVACDNDQNEEVDLSGKLGIPMPVPGGPDNMLCAWIGIPGSEWTEIPNAGMMATSLIKGKLRTGSCWVVVHPDDIAALFALQPAELTRADEITVLVQTRCPCIEFQIKESGNEQLNGYYCFAGLDEEARHTYSNVNQFGVTVRWLKCAWVLQASDRTMCTCHKDQKTVPFQDWHLDPHSPNTLVQAPTLTPIDGASVLGSAVFGVAKTVTFVGVNPLVIVAGNAAEKVSTLIGFTRTGSLGSACMNAGGHIGAAAALGGAIAGPPGAVAGTVLGAGTALINSTANAASSSAARSRTMSNRSLLMGARERWADFHTDQETEISIRPDTPWQAFKVSEGLLQHIRHHGELGGLIRGLEQVVLDVETKMQELRTRPESRDMANKLDDDELAGIVLYTHDNSTGQKDGNFYYEENKDLRKRCDQARLTTLRRWGTHVYYTLRGLGKLDNVERLAYRGLPDKDRVGQDYLKGRPIQYGAFTSTTTKLEEAKGFADSNGVILKLDIRTGKDIHQLSMFEEGEVLLTPNHQFIVTRELYEEDGHWFVDLLETRSGELKT